MLLVLISHEIVRCHTLTKTGARTLPYDAEPTDARRSALQPAIAALGLEPAAFSVADLKCLLIVATRGAGNQLFLKASSADERREWGHASSRPPRRLHITAAAGGRLVGAGGEWRQQEL